MKYKLGFHVEITNKDHPNAGAQGKIIGVTYNKVTEQFRYRLDIGLPFKNDCPADVWANENEITLWHRTYKGLQHFLAVSGRELDKELAGHGGYDYENIGLPPAPNSVDGPE